MISIGFLNNSIYNEDMKKDTIICVFAILVLVAAGFLHNYKSLQIHKNTPVTVEENPNKACYLNHVSTAFGDDDTYLEVIISAGGIVTGMFNVLPATKNTLTGPFVGNWVEDRSSVSLILTVNHTYTSEGITTQEPRVFRLIPNSAEISWDEGKTFTQTLPQVNCMDMSDDIVKGR